MEYFYLKIAAMLFTKRAVNGTWSELLNQTLFNLAAQMAGNLPAIEGLKYQNNGVIVTIIGCKVCNLKMVIKNDLHSRA